ncbi:phosphoribosylformylglycinamidine synthase subunit PurL [bacterium]|jgi:phosphoribosylformylglycinamidine synthase|nr:phosphoribosylformylglycinamidine synthase subunit PurL [bacterium]MBT3795661.1 phosphoribosylformylglycinamidine synthase subunit PurL [bacterium]
MDNLAFALENGLTRKEFKLIVDKLKREPNKNEIGVIAAMWSEHCSYKSSKFYLKKLPTKGKCVIQGPGENAGVIDIGDNQCLVFKIESHNHPSFIEPYQGAATGVGGILRDIFTMGARPIALMNSLRFGNPKKKDTKRVVNGVVSGIAGYGNCMGIPTVGGEVYFDDCYNGNPLVNAFAIGIAKKDKIFKGLADGPGNPVFYLGAKTGRDGVKGAIMASDIFESQEDLDRPTVQIGDPFKEKLLLEACLEMFKLKGIVGIQDMGAAGLTSSASEMASRSNNGIMLDLDKIPKRDSNITPYEMLLSESQERMLLVLDNKNNNRIKTIFKKWGLDSSKIGEVIRKRNFIIKSNKKVVVDIPVSILTDDCPIYQRKIKKPRSLRGVNKLVNDDICKIKFDSETLLKKLLKDENICSREWVFNQFDYMVGTNTLVRPGSDSAIIRIKGTKKAIALTTNCNPNYCELDPSIGASIAVAESTRNIIASGGKPLAITNCLNFGNPEKPEIMWQFAEAINGLSKASKTFNTPVVSGNVSLYNETYKKAIKPTPTISMVGLVEDYKLIKKQWFKNEGDDIILIGRIKNDFGGSQVLKYLNLKKKVVSPPEFKLDTHLKINQFIYKIIRKFNISSVHDISEGGLMIALSESCFNPKQNIGAKINLKSTGLKHELSLFAESQGCYLISSPKDQTKKIKTFGTKNNINVKVIGEVGGDSLILENSFSIKINNLFKIWKNGFPN